MMTEACDPDYLCHAYIQVNFQNIQGHSEKKQSNTEKIPETYGEILYESVDKLLDFVSLDQQDVFLDLGSGLGKLAVQVFMKTDVKAVYGIELLSRLCKFSQQIEAKMKQDIPAFFEDNRLLHFIEGDFLTTPWPKATCVYIGSPCFGPEMFRRLAMRINEHDTITTVLSLRPLPYLNTKRFSFTKALRLEGTWDTTLCFAYQT